MKFSLIITVLCFISQISFAQEQKSESFKVSGNCDMCKNRIEKAALKVIGVKSADWNESTKMLQVNYVTSETDLTVIKKSVAAVGHDSDTEKASEKSYQKLHECCQYPRDKALEEASNGTVQTAYFKISGMTCADGCAKGIEKALYKQKGVKQSEVNFDTGIARVVFEKSKLSIDQMKKTIEEYNAEGESTMYKAELVKK